MECTVADNLLKESIGSSVDTWLRELSEEGYDLKVGEKYALEADDIDFLKEFFNTKIRDKFGEKYVGEVDIIKYPSGKEYNSIMIDPSYSKLLADYIVAEVKGETSILGNNTSGVENARVLLNESVYKNFEEKQDTLQEFLVNAATSLRKLTRIGDIKKFINENNLTDGDLMKELRALYTNTYANLHNDDFTDKTKAFANYLLEANVKVEAFLEFAKKEDSVYKLQEVYTLAKGYKPVFEELSKFLRRHDSNNPLSKIINKTSIDLEKLEGIYLEKSEKEVSTKIFESSFNHPRRKANIEKHRKAIAQFKILMASQKLNGKTKQAEKTQRKIDNLEKQIEKLDINPDKIGNVLSGKEGDISMWSSLLMSASSNSDIVVSGVGDFFRKQMGRLNIEVLLPISTRFFTMMDKYGDSPFSPEQFFKKFTRRRMSYYYDSKTEKVVETEIVELLHGTLPAFYEKREKLEAEMKKANAMFRKYDEGTDEWIKANDDKDTAYKNLQDFWRTSQESQYKKVFYDTRDRHDKEKADFKVKFREYINNTGFNIDDIYKDLQEEKKAIYQDATLLGKFKLYSHDQRDRLDEIKREEKRIRSVEYIKNNMPDNEHREVRIALAEMLSRQRRENSEFHEFTSTDEGDARWEQDMKALAELKPELTDDQYKRLKSTMVTYKYPKEFSEELNRILDKTGKLMKQLTDKTGYEAPQEIADAWTKIRDTASPYRDNVGVIDGSLLNEAEQNVINQLQQFIVASENSMADILHIRKDQERISNRMAELVKKFERGEGTANARRLDYQELQDLKEERKNLKENAIADFGVGDILAEIKALKVEKNNLIVREETEYYYETLEQQKDLYIQKNPLEVSSFSTDFYDYRVIDRQWNKSPKGQDTWEVLLGDIGNVWRSANESGFQKSKWFQDNHLLTSYYDPVLKEKVERYDPTYIWVKTLPKDTYKYPLREEPGFKYKTMKVKDKYLTEVATDEFTGRAKAIGFRDNEYYKLKGTKDGILLDELLSEYKTAQGLFPPGKRMGYRVPSISRENNLINFFTNKELRNRDTQHQMLMRSMTTTAQDNDEGEALADTEGVDLRTLPHHYSSSLDADLVSTDIVSSIMKYSMAAHRTKFMREEMVPMSSSMLDVMKNNTPTTGKKDKVWASIFNSLDGQLVSKLGLKGMAKKANNENNRLAMMTEFVDTFYYGRDVVESATPTFKLGKHTIRFDKVLGNLRGIKSFLTMSALPGPYIIANQMGNVANGMFNQLIHTLTDEGHVKFTFKQWVKAHREYGKYSVGFSSMGINKGEGTLVGDYMHGRVGEGQSQFGQFMDHFNVLEDRVYDEHSNIIKGKNHWRKLISSDFLFFVRNAAELRLYGTTFIAYMRSQQVEINGEKATLWDAYNGTQLKTGVTMNGKPVNEDQVRSDIQYMLRITQGNYAKFDKTLFENRWFGSGLMYMKKFWVEFFLARYGKERFNVNQQDIVNGYWRDTFNNLSIVLDNPKNWGQNFQNLTPTEKTNVKKAGLELAFIVTTGAATSLLFGYDDKDEERFDKMEARNDTMDWALYFLLKTNAEMKSMTAFGGLTETWKSAEGLLGGVLPYGRESLRILKNDIEWHGPVPLPTAVTKRKQLGYDAGTNKLYIDMIKLLSIPKPARFNAEETVRNFEKSRNF